MPARATKCPEYVSVGDGILPSSSYLATPVVELIGHADDLSCSVGIASDPPVEAIEVPVATTLDAAIPTRLRALTRHERAPTTISVF